MQTTPSDAQLEAVPPGATVAAGPGLLDGYPGSKGGAGVYHQIIRQMPPHERYVELFAGAANVFRHKRCAAVNCLVEIDPSTAAQLWYRFWPTRTSYVEIRTECALRFLAMTPAMKDPGTLLYADPPYLRSVRTRLFYDWEFDTEQQHRSLLLALLEARCLCMISGYWSPLYADLLDSWRCVTFQAMTRGGPRTECLWCNFPEPTLLHDPRFAGKDFRERERIGRKRDRWQRRFAAMPAVERQVIAQALALADPLTLAAAVRSASSATEIVDREFNNGNQGG